MAVMGPVWEPRADALGKEAGTGGAVREKRALWALALATEAHGGRWRLGCPSRAGPAPSAFPGSFPLPGPVPPLRARPTPLSRGPCGCSAGRCGAEELVSLAVRGAFVGCWRRKPRRRFLFLFLSLHLPRRAAQVCIALSACWLLTPCALCSLSVADINLNSPNKGLLADTMTDVPVDSGASARAAAPEGLTLAEEEELRSELAKVTPVCERGPWFCSAGKEQTRAPGAGFGC